MTDAGNDAVLIEGVAMGMHLGTLHPRGLACDSRCPSAVFRYAAKNYRRTQRHLRGSFGESPAINGYFTEFLVHRPYF